MSLVNQMLQDLERRRTAETTVSPLGGLSASGASVMVSQSINYLLLGVTLVLAFLVIFVLVYWFEQKQIEVDESIDLVTPVTATDVSENKIKKVASIIEVTVEPEVRQPAVDVGSTHVSQVEEKVSQQENIQRSESIKNSDVESEKSGVISIRASSVENTKGLVSVGLNAQDESSVTHSAVNKTIRPLTSEQQAQVAFQNAVKLLGRGDESGAQQKLEIALSMEPLHLRARETLSALLLNTGQISEAADKLSEGLRLRPTSTSLAKMYARVLVDQDDNDAAISVLERARPVVAADPEYFALLAALYRTAGKHAQASQVYQQILQVRPGVAAWWMGLALSEDEMGAGAKALSAYQRAQRSGGLKAEVLQYVQSRIAALTYTISENLSPAVVDDSNGFED